MYVISNAAVPGLVTALVTDASVLLVDDKFDIDHDNMMELFQERDNKAVQYVIEYALSRRSQRGHSRKLQALNAIVVASDEARAKMSVTNQPGLPNLTVGSTTHHLHREQDGQDHPGGTRAHQNGDVVVLFPDQRVLASGDVTRTVLARISSRVNAGLRGRRQRESLASGAGIGT